MHPFSVLTLGIFVAGYITARWDLVTRLYELAIFAWDHGVVTRAAKGFAVISIFFFLFLIPVERLAAKESDLVRHGIMTTRDNALMRIFWPSDAPSENDTSGVLVGWRNSDLDVLVVAVLQGVDIKSVDHALRMHTLFRGAPHSIERILQRCGDQPLQLEWDPNILSIYTVGEHSLPRVHCQLNAGIMVQVIVFDRPDPSRMQYLSLSPISLALGDKLNTSEIPSPFDEIATGEETERKRKQKLVEKLKLHTVVRHPRTEKERALPTLVSQINCSAELNTLMQRNIALVGIRIKRTLSVSERVVESAHEARDLVWLWSKQTFVLYMWPFASKVFTLLLMFNRVVAEIVLHLLDWRPLKDSAALKDISATAQQVDIRLQQFCYWPAQYVTLHRRRTDWESITNSHPEYIRFFNSLWLVANDVIIGIALGSYIIENAAVVASQVDSAVDAFAIEGLQRMILWLMDWPAGLKLNTELAAFLGDLFLWVIDYWAHCMRQLQPLLPSLVRLIGLTSFAGASLPIALFSDLISLLTLHVYSFYIASARIYGWQLTILGSLFHLFRGKKRNVLRSRIDSCDYDLDQLLLGTILFTLLFFLLPTVAVFYATFAGARMTIIALKAALDTLLACLNHFPLFALMLRVKDSRRLPGGIHFQLCSTTPPLPSSHSDSKLSLATTAPTSYIKLNSIPLSLSQTFDQYAQLGDRLRKHYLSPRVFLALALGSFVPPMHRQNLYSLQYSMLPARRVGIAELWRLINGEDEVSKGQEAERSGLNIDSMANGHAGSGARVRGAPTYWWSR
ncbi:N-acetylglucosaminyl transferase component Gpi1 [Polychaeton citri CBS 116435]|uniref:N-acetylglucosaminyl transferase component Gpi1 n=1 Tax=Polychaeton citri CBS 116435 TaxID=1314669 RepID=A0A9P4UR21_9PEZI|nr:N-acetylglucosaminyl transferase component Gpi1 [Polychaeton citri CBS 116435]